METYIIYLLGALAAIVFFQAGKHYGQSKEYKSWMHTIQQAYVSQEWLRYVCMSISNKKVSSAMERTLIFKAPAADLNAAIECVVNNTELVKLPGGTKPERYQVQGPNQHGDYLVIDTLTDNIETKRRQRVQAASYAFVMNHEDFRK